MDNFQATQKINLKFKFELEFGFKFERTWSRGIKFTFRLLV